MKLATLKIFAMVLFSAQVTLADQFKPATLAPITHASASLTVVDPEGRETVYSPAELEEFATYGLITTTPWREEAAEFEGIRLSDLLAAHGLDNVSVIVVTAENDYRTTFSKELLESVDIMVATRVDGRPHSRRHRGPIQFVIGADAYAASPLASEANFVWMAARIEPGE